MKIVGLELEKLYAEKKAKFIKGASADTNIEYIDVEREENADFKTGELLKVKFDLSVKFTSTEGKKKEELAESGAKGYLFITASPEEAKLILKNSKKNSFSNDIKTIFFNFISRRVIPKITQLQTDVSLPSPFLRIPQLKVQHENQSTN